MLILAVCVMIFTNYTLLLLASVVCIFIILQFGHLTNQKTSTVTTVSFTLMLICDCLA